MKYRNELKYLINYHDYTFIKLRLKDVLSVDTNVNADGSYNVRSLYFDDYYNSAYNDKYAGVLNRSKYRIRIYNLSERTTHLERKTKIGAYNNKETAGLTVEAVYCILYGDYEFL